MPVGHETERPNSHRPARNLLAVLDLARAAVELGIARMRLDSPHAKKLVAQAPTAKAKELSRAQDAIAARVAFAIPRVAERLPWRTDCLVQALAAERWLSRLDVPSALFLGVPKTPRKEFAAHAWVKAGERVVTGGDIRQYVPFTR